LRKGGNKVVYFDLIQHQYAVIGYANNWKFFCYYWDSFRFPR
jgi:hypothetical protein